MLRLCVIPIQLDAYYGELITITHYLTDNEINNELKNIACINLIARFRHLSRELLREKINLF